MPWLSLCLLLGEKMIFTMMIMIMIMTMMGHYQRAPRSTSTMPWLSLCLLLGNCSNDLEEEDYGVEIDIVKSLLHIFYSCFTVVNAIDIKYLSFS